MTFTQRAVHYILDQRLCKLACPDFVSQLCRGSCISCSATDRYFAQSSASTIAGLSHVAVWNTLGKAYKLAYPPSEWRIVVPDFRQS
jgi:hypothetical protein